MYRCLSRCIAVLLVCCLVQQAIAGAQHPTWGSSSSSDSFSSGSSSSSYSSSSSSDVDSPQGEGCQTNFDCNDYNPCTDDVCIGCQCYNTYNCDPCDDGLECTTNDVCVQGDCVGEPVICNDYNECTTDYCHEETGCCVYANNYNECDDGDSCTYNDVCCGGECVGTPVCPEPAIYHRDVFAGQWFKSGELTIYATSTHLVVKWEAETGWSAKKFHIYAGTVAPGSAPGQYPFKFNLPYPVTSYTFSIPLSSIFSGACCSSSLYIAFHAETINNGQAACVQSKGCPGSQETSWMFGPYDLPHGWGWYDYIQLCCCYHP